MRATEQREGLPRFLRDSVAQRVARAAGARTLFVPKHGKGFVAPPAVELPKSEHWSWELLLRSGDPVERILEAASELRPDLIVKTSDGRDSFLDRFQGSHAEQIVRGAPCPVASIPVPKPR